MTTTHTTITDPTTSHSSPRRTKPRRSMGKAVAAVLLSAGVLLGVAGAATANTGGAQSTSSISRSTTIMVDPNLVHPDAPVVLRTLPRVRPGLVKTDCFFDVGSGLFVCP